MLYRFNRYTVHERFVRCHVYQLTIYKLNADSTPAGNEDFSIFDPRADIPVCSFHVCEALSSCIIHRNTFSVWNWEKWLFMHLCIAATFHETGGEDCRFNLWFSDIIWWENNGLFFPQSSEKGWRSDIFKITLLLVHSLSFKIYF